ncbi:MAG: hemolysin-type calcium-binding repeat family protein, partial [Alphaproteobacteria bacterium]|nr:hemolysin-type calcium-binding repeat family protein [Alphaproteobacteria bacterium]
MTTFTGGTDDDIFVGGIDPDQATGGPGNDILFGLGGNDMLDGGSGDDALDGGADGDTLIGGTGRDSLSGGNGDDRLFSEMDLGNYQAPYYNNIYTAPLLDRGAEVDTLTGGAGSDTLSAGYGDNVDGGSDSDMLFISFLGAPNGVSADFRQLSTDPNNGLTIGGGTIVHVESIAWLEGSNFDDLLALDSGGGAFAPIFGMGGNDHIIGGYYTGTMFGGDGNDLIDATGAAYGFGAYGEAGDDTIVGGTWGPGLLDGGDGNDTISTAGMPAHGGAGNDTITETGGNSYGASLLGEAGDDIIYGSSQSNTVADGGDGNDTIYGDYPSDPGGAFFGNDYLNGGAGHDVIYGDLGNDTIDGGADDDLLYGGGNNDTINGGSGNDAADGGSGDDSIYGGDGDDLLLSGAGADQLSGEAGNDRLYFGASFGTGDLAAGGVGSDQLILQGDYSAGLTLASSNSLQIETLRLLSGSDASFVAAPGGSLSYNLTFGDNLIAAGTTFTVDGAGLAAGEALVLNASAETNGAIIVTSGAGNDDVTGGGGADTFFLQKGGNDRATGGGGDDGFFFGGALTAADTVDGGTGTDTVALQGNYAAGVTLSGIANVEFLSLLSGANTQFGEPGTNRFSYALTTTDSNVAAGQTLTVQATGLLATETLTFNGSAETNGNFRVFAGQGNDVLTGGAGSDGFFFGSDGNLTGADRIDGGAGTDSIALRGNYALVLQDATFRNVEVLAFLSGHTNEYGGALVPGGFDYDVALANGNVAAGQTLDVNGATLRADESLRFDGRAESDGAFRILSGAG